MAQQDARERVTQLEQQLGYYRDQQAQIVNGTRAVLEQALAGAHDVPSTGITLQGTEEQVHALVLLASARLFVVQLKDVVDQAKQLERHVRSTDSLQFQEVEGVVEGARAAASLYASAVQQHEQLASTSGSMEHPLPQPLLDKQREVLQRLQASRDQLHQRLTRQIHYHLEQCGWPPPITAGGQAHQQQPLQQQPLPSGAPGAPLPPPAAGGQQEYDPDSLFSPAHTEHVAALQRLLVALTDVQKLQEGDALQQGHASTSTTHAPPLLWAAQEVMAPLTAKLATYFGLQSEAGRVDKPEWLLNTVLRLAKEYAPRLEFLQGVVEATGLSASGYNFSVESARALRETAKQLLREQLLPALAAATAQAGLAGHGHGGGGVVSGAAAAAMAAASAAASAAAGIAGAIPMAAAPLSALQGAAQMLPGQRLPGSAAAGPTHGPTAAAAPSAGQVQALWLHLIDCLIGFEIRFAPLLGVVLADYEELPAVVLAHSTLSVLAEHPEWMDAWMASEAASAAQQLDGILYSPDAWEPATVLIAEDRPAWHCELWPPMGAEKVVTLIQTLLQRVRYIPQPAGQHRYLRIVVAEVLLAAHGRVQRMLQQAHLFNDILNMHWGPKVAVCICFCHYVEHHLQEMVAALPLSLHPTGSTHEPEPQQPAADQQPGTPQHSQQSQPYAPAVGPASGHPVTPVPNGVPPGAFMPQPAASPAANGAPATPGMPQPPPGSHPAAATPSGGFTPGGAFVPGLAAAAAPPGTPEPLPSAPLLGDDAKAAVRAVERALADFGACKREWVLKVAKAAAQGFLNKAHGYIHLEGAFKEVDPAAAGSGVVSGPLQDALAWLQACLHMLSTHLDQMCFRGVWTATAAAINRELFNLVATEHIFSAAGARQLSTDAGALLRVFATYTRKPRSHFRELCDSVALLSLEGQQAEFVHQAVAPSRRQANAQDVLKSVGVYTLDPEQADAVLGLRM